MALSSELADATLRVLDGCVQVDFFEPELRCADAACATAAVETAPLTIDTNRTRLRVLPLQKKD